MLCFVLSPSHHHPWTDIWILVILKKKYSGFGVNTIPTDALAREVPSTLTHWGRVTHMCVSTLTMIGRRQATASTNAGMLLIGRLETNFNESIIEIHTFSFKKMRLKMSCGKWRPFCLGLNVLTGKVFTVGQTTCIVVPDSMSSPWVKPDPRYDSRYKYILHNL